MFELVAPTPDGRCYEGGAVVRLGDSSPGGRARFDAIARHLQDVSDDDARAAGFGDAAWVVRRTAIAVRQFPTYLEQCGLRTWCSGLGAAWAERRVRLTGERGGEIDAATLWVLLDPVSQRPARLAAAFLDAYGPSAAGRMVSSKPRLAPAPADAWVAGRPWPLRFVDFDVMGHVNNAAYWAVVEEQLTHRRDLRAPLTAVIEHGAPVQRDDVVRWHAADTDDGFVGWLVGDGAGGAPVQFAAVRVSAGV